MFDFCILMNLSVLFMYTICKCDNSQRVSERLARECEREIQGERESEFYLVHLQIVIITNGLL